MRQVISRNGTWLVRCYPRYHSIEGGGVELFTPQVRQTRTVQRCITDPGAQRYLGWQPEWIADLMGPDPRRVRYDPRPQPWLGEFLMFGVRRMGSSEIVGHAWMTFDEDGVAEGSLGLRPDQRRAGLAMSIGVAGAAFLHRHLGYEVAQFHTEVTNVGVHKVSERAGREPDDSTSVRHLPDGRTVESNLYRSVEPDVTCVCRRWQPRHTSGDAAGSQ
ncbi:MAG: GNAT family protein [Ilumatobacteraceae bacterium]|nr:GNAT family protein [Ilumatobacteraceae bacterium]